MPRGVRGQRGAQVKPGRASAWRRKSRATIRSRREPTRNATIINNPSSEEKLEEGGSAGREAIRPEIQTGETRERKIPIGQRTPRKSEIGADELRREESEDSRTEC